MFVNFFIRRPIFASVCAMVIVLAGAVSIPTLPIAQYPELAAPQVQVVSNYVGASAEVVESTVTTPLERQINGAEGMRYLSSTSSNDGTSQITATFDVGVNKDLAAVDVQNRVNAAVPLLPAEVKNTGVTILKTTPAIVLAIGFYSDDGSLSNLFISNYLDLYVRDEIRRIPGAADVRIFGERRYAMRLWLDPLRLAARGLTAEDVVTALREQNVNIAAGQVGQPPAPPHQTFQISVRAQGRLTDPHQFEGLIVKRGADGSLIYLRDVGRAELGAEDYSLDLRFDGRSAVGIGVFQQPDANALQLESAIRDELQRLSASFPPSLKYRIAFNPTTAVRESIHEVLVTLLEAIALVVLVIFLFLQDWRATLIPAITIPVSLVGTFGFVKAFGFSINTLTMFGIVLATGLVVDDAIVVVENISRNLGETRGDAHAAAQRAMREVTGAVIATSLVLVAVFVPVAFLSGTTGRLYRQFSLTIAFSVSISAFNALTLSPALSALLMRPAKEHRFVVFRAFNRGFDWVRGHYHRALGWQVKHLTIAGLVFLAGLGLTVLVFLVVPRSFVPDEDQNYFIVQLIGPQGASLDYMSDIAAQAEAKLRARPEVQDLFSVLGFSFTGGGANRGIIFVSLSPISERPGAAHAAPAMVADLQRTLGALPGAIVVPFLPPPIQGQGATGGFTLQLVDKGGGQSFAPLATAGQAVSGAAMQSGKIKGVFSTFSVDDPQLTVNIDRDKALGVGVSVGQIADTLGVYFGSQYVNDFDFGPRSYRVYAQAEAKFRDQPRDLGAVYVRTQAGALTPLDNFVRVTPGTAPPVISHYDLYRSVELDGTPAAGVSSGQAIEAMERVARQALPAEIGYEWSGLSWEEVRAGHQALIIFALGLTFVFLVLSAQYESFALPLVIILAVPLALLGALGLQRLRGLTNDVFCQIGLLMLIGLASKNAILIVEFAEQLRAQGASKVDAVTEAAMLRLRPILMTSLAFLIGILPLVFASGSGANARHSLGTTLFGGLLLSTILNLFLTPALYLVTESVRARFRRPPRNGIHPAPDTAPGL
ncbi:MAG TPA: multidrug efflux RND transporter permease subunit [Polyangia bacterium]|nr:multidrug efflux RND transporter permease subunit [Polyangia bacterium]